MAPQRVYDHPELYDQAFAWRDYAAETAVIHQLWRRMSPDPLGRVLELACGSAPHAPELIASGVGYLGLDRAPAMLRAARARAPAAGLLLGDLHLPALDRGGVDLVLSLLGSFSVEGPEQLQADLDRIAALLRPGGGWLLDWCVLFDEVDLHQDEWHVDAPAGRAQVRYRTRWLDRERELIEESLWIRRRELVVHERNVSWALTAERFFPLLAAHPQWELVGCWNDWDPAQPLPQAEILRPLVLLRRR